MRKAHSPVPSARAKLLRVANKGTIFLDEVGELPMATQARLLRVLETGEYIRVGGQKIMKTDIRIVAATNVNMRKAISEGRFREDLYYSSTPFQYRYRRCATAAKTFCCCSASLPCRWPRNIICQNNPL